MALSGTLEEDRQVEMVVKQLEFLHLPTDFPDGACEVHGNGEVATVVMLLEERGWELSRYDKHKETVKLNFFDPKIPVFLGLPLGFTFFLASEEQSTIVINYKRRCWWIRGTPAGSGELRADVEQIAQVLRLRPVEGAPRLKLCDLWSQLHFFR